MVSRFVTVVLVAGSLTGCQTMSMENFQSQHHFTAIAKDEFRQGNYGKANKAFLKAVRMFPNDPEARLGLAATYDRLHRFDLSDKEYRVLSRMIGDRPEYHNNVGYSYLLRGELRAARRNFLKAYELDPANEVTINNLQMLKSSVSISQNRRHERSNASASQG